ncbi:MAG TPA: cytochrome c [Candidatus Limnocylindrales bacterium]
MSGRVVALATAVRGLAAAGAVVVAAAAIGLGLLGPTGVVRAAPGASSPPPGASQVADLDTGRSLFLQSCASCHGAGGEGGPSGPSIQNAGAALADFVLRSGRMPLADRATPMQRGEPVFDDAQIRALVGYVASLGSGPAIPSVQTTGADLAAGQQLYAANCAACHGAGGAGGTVGSDVAPGLSHADPTTVGEAVVSGPGPMPVFAFGQDQLNSLAAYVESLKSLPHPGGLEVAEIGPVAEGFLAGFVGIVTLLAVARWTASGSIDDDVTTPDDEANE